MTPFLVILLLASGLANLASGEGYGLPTQSSWGINIWGVNRHPAQVYEIVFGIITGVLVWRNRKDMISIPGYIFVYFGVITCSTRILSETFRGDAVLIFGTFRLWQLIALFGLAFGLFKLGKIRASRKSSTEE